MARNLSPDRRRGTHNPYTPDAGARPPMLAGRDAELAQLGSIVTQLAAGGTEQHVLITGLRGVGKTVLLNEFERLAQDAGWPAETKEVGRRSSVATLVGRVARRALLQMSTRKRVGDRLRRAMSVLKSFELALPGEVSFKLEVGPALGEADSGDLADDLRDVLVAVGEAAAEAGSGFALIFDELQNLSADDYEALIMALHRVKQKGLPVAFVGAGLPLLPTLTAEAKSYAERMFAYATLGPLSEQAAREALAAPARGQGVRWEDGAVRHVLAYTEGYPYFLQEYGRRAWAQETGAVISTRDVRATQVLVEDFLDTSFFEPRIGRLAESERTYASAMAALGDGPQQSSAVAGRLGRAIGSVSTLRDALIASAVIYSPRRGYVDFTVPHCASFVRRRYPLGGG
ncbi:MAG: AAA family ATPase [Conexibacter sp.]